MPIKSKWPPLKIADCSIANLVFTSPTHPLPNKPAFIDAENPGHFLTLQTFRLWSQRLAAGLRKHGFQPDDRLLLFSGNNIYFPVVLFGTIMAGGIFTGANPSYVARELAYQLKNSDAKFLLCSSASLDVGLDAASQIGMPKSSIFVFDDKAAPSPAQSGCKHWSALLASESEGRRFEWNPCTKPGESDKTIVLNYSSGTTGVPKGVEITHKNYVSNCSQQAFMFDNKENSEEDLKTEVGLCFLPMYHAMAQTYYSVMYPLRGIPVYIMPKFDFEKMLGAIQKYKVTALMVVPPIIVALAKHPAVRKWTWDLSSIRSIGCGAAPLGPDISKEFESLWKGKPQQDTINVKQGWGMTEYV